MSSLVPAFHPAQRQRKPPWLFLLGLMIGSAMVTASLTLFAIAALRTTNQNGVAMPSQVNSRVAMSAASERYWRTLDVARAEKDFAGWSRENLAKIFAGLQEEVTDPETRAHLASLARLLDLPGSEFSLMASLSSQTGFVLSVMLSVVPILIGLTIVLVPRVRSRPDILAGLVVSDEPGEKTALDEELEPDPRMKQPDANAPEEEEPASQDEPPASEEEPQAGKRKSKTSQDEAHASEEEPLAAKGGAKTKKSGPKAAEGKEFKASEETEEISEEEGEERKTQLGDLASLFEVEDNTLATLDGLCKGLEDVDVNELVEQSNDVLERLMQPLIVSMETLSKLPATHALQL